MVTTLTAPSHSAHTTSDEIAPIILRGALSEKLTAEEFFTLCHDNPTLRLERLPDQSIVIMAPAGAYSGSRSGEAFLQLGIWHRQHARGIVCDSSAGFTLPDSSVRSPDASWISDERWAVVSTEDREKFAHVCPDFVIEVASPSDSLRSLQAKMVDWIANGARLGFLISPLTETAWIYRGDGTVLEVTDFNAELPGDDVLPGFRLELRRLRRQ